MKKFLKLTTVVLLGLTCATFTAVAHEDDEEDELEAQERVYQPEATFQRYETNREVDQRRNYRRRDGLGRLQREVDHVNAMLAHVRNSMRRYGASRDAWRHYEHVQGEVRQINRQFRRGEQYYNRRGLLRQSSTCMTRCAKSS